MSTAPLTRHSLILRLRDREDAAAWREFVRLYEPVIYRVAKRRGFQDADAAELVQQVMLAVTRAVDRFAPDRSRARFRTWLYRITHNEFCKAYHAQARHRGSGDTAVQELLEAQAEPVDDAFECEYRRSVFRWAADQVRPQVKHSTWRAFWLTSVEGKSAEQAARELQVSVGTIYVARSRVMARLQKAAAALEADSHAL